MAGFIEFQNVTKRYSQDAAEMTALDDVSFDLDEGELCVIIGSSGAGKTTALNIMGGIDRATSGTVIIDGKEITAFSEKNLTIYRRKEVGFVFQFYNLIQSLTAIENVQLALEISKNPMDAQQVLEVVGLLDKLNSFPAQLSGGEQQRVAIARAMAKRPKLLLCDEPTGALDDKTGSQILQLLQKLSEDVKMTIVIISHNLAIAEMATKVIRMRNGAIESIDKNAKPRKAGEIVL